MPAKPTEQERLASESYDRFVAYCADKGLKTPETREQYVAGWMAQLPKSA